MSSKKFTQSERNQLAKTYSWSLMSISTLILVSKYIREGTKTRKSTLKNKSQNTKGKDGFIFIYERK